MWLKPASDARRPTAHRCRGCAPGPGDPLARVPRHLPATRPALPPPGSRGSRRGAPARRARGLARGGRQAKPQLTHGAFSARAVVHGHAMAHARHGRVHGRVRCGLCWPGCAVLRGLWRQLPRARLPVPRPARGSTPQLLPGTLLSCHQLVDCECFSSTQAKSSCMCRHSIQPTWRLAVHPPGMTGAAHVAALEGDIVASCLHATMMVCLKTSVSEKTC